MENPETYSWLDEAVTSLTQSFGSMDLSTIQPTSWRHFQPLADTAWLDWFERIIDAREAKGVPFAEVATALSPGLARCQLFFTLEDLKSARAPLQRRLKFIRFFHDAIDALSPQGDLFGLQKTTRKHSPEDIARIRQRHFMPGTPEVARELGRLYNGAYNLAAALYLDFYMDKANENLGPYPLEEERIMVIKEMEFLRPTEIWPEVKSACDSLILYAVYEGVRFSTDFIPCHSQYDGSTIEGLREWRLERDGKAVEDIGEVKELVRNLADAGKDQWLRVKGLSEQELLNACVWIRCYCFKKLCDLLGVDWKPSPELLQSVRGKTLAEGWARWNAPLAEPALTDYWKRIWDAREEFYG